MIYRADVVIQLLAGGADHAIILCPPFDLLHPQLIPSGHVALGKDAGAFGLGDQPRPVFTGRPPDFCVRPARRDRQSGQLTAQQVDQPRQRAAPVDPVGHRLAELGGRGLREALDQIVGIRLGKLQRPLVDQIPGRRESQFRGGRISGILHSGLRRGLDGLSDRGRYSVCPLQAVMEGLPPRRARQENLRQGAGVGFAADQFSGQFLDHRLQRGRRHVHVLRLFQPGGDLFSDTRIAHYLGQSGHQLVGHIAEAVPVFLKLLRRGVGGLHDSQRPIKGGFDLRLVVARLAQVPAQERADRRRDDDRVERLLRAAPQRLFTPAFEIGNGRLPQRR